MWNYAWLPFSPVRCFRGICKCRPVAWTGFLLCPRANSVAGRLILRLATFPDARYLSSSFIVEPLSEENNVVIARRGHNVEA